MINTFDVGTKDRPSNVIFYSLNGMHGRKLSGTIDKKELSRNLINIYDIFANMIKQGKISEEKQESFESHVSQFLGENKDKFFTIPHEDLDRVTKAGFESFDIAREEANKRTAYAQPVMDTESYDKPFRKLG